MLWFIILPEIIRSCRDFSENLINQLNMRLCMNSWNEKSSNYLHKLAMCIATVSSRRYGCQSYFEVHHKNPKLFLSMTTRPSPRSSDFIEERDQRGKTGSFHGTRVFCTGARHWVCRALMGMDPRIQKESKKNPQASKKAWVRLDRLWCIVVGVFEYMNT